MADFSKCKQGDKLKSESWGEVEFVAFMHGKDFPVVAILKDGTLIRRMADGSSLSDFVDLSIPPKTKTVKQWVGIAKVGGHWVIVAADNERDLRFNWNGAQDVHEIEFTVREEEK